MNNKYRTLFLLLCFILIRPFESFAAKSPNCTAKRQHTKVADFGKTAMPLTALGISVIKFDWLGAVLSQVLAHGLYLTNGKFEHKIDKKRPCGCSGAFPSGHMIMYASSSSYLHYRYGWQYGLPAYLATIGFSYDRVRNKAHSWGDMLGTFAIVNVITYIVTPRFDCDVEYLPSFDDDDEKKPRECQEPIMQFSSDIQPSKKAAFLSFKVKF
jgi:membrane-associated phospholipid phosphatase